MQSRLIQNQKFPAEYFREENFIKNTTKYEYCQGSALPHLHISFGIDSNFCRQLGVTLVSILENNPDMTFSFHIFMDHIAAEDEEKIALVARKYLANVYVYFMFMEPFENFPTETTEDKSYIYKIICFRLYMNKILRKVAERFLYLDADLFCLGSLRSLLEIDFAGTAIAAVYDDYGMTHDTYAETPKYFNAGVMLINCEEWEKQQVTEKAFSCQDMLSKECIFLDQTILNRIFKGNVKFLDSKFNTYGNTDPAVDCIIYHFNGRAKPWYLPLRPIHEQWRHYLKLSPWEDIVCDKLPPKKVLKANYHYCKDAARYYMNKGEVLNAIYLYLYYKLLKLQSHLNSNNTGE